MSRNGISTEEALERIHATGSDFYDLLARAGRLREKHFGHHVQLCAILNARCGGCAEDCAFCAQSSRNRAPIERWPLVDEDTMLEAARNASRDKAERLGLVTSGTAVRPGRDLETLARAISRMKEEGTVTPCASLGMLKEDELIFLRRSGLERFHHNLETARSHFPNICTTHPYDQAVETVRTAKKAGLSICCGGIFGLGENAEQRVELLETIRDLDVDSVPLNFLVPIDGTPLEGKHDLTPTEALKAIAVTRLMMPDKEIRIAGGREFNLREMQSWIFLAGANGMMIGNYLTTRGRHLNDDLQMIRDQELIPEGAETSEK